MINYLKISLQKMYKFENFESVRREIVSFNRFIYGTYKKKIVQYVAFAVRHGTLYTEKNKFLNLINNLNSYIISKYHFS